MEVTVLKKHNLGSLLLVSFLFISLFSLGLPVYATDVLQVNSTDFFFGWSNTTGDQIYNNDTSTSYNCSYIYDNATLTTRSLSDFGSSQTNYATLYIIDHDFCFGWSSTIYDIYRNQSYECIGEAGYLDWNYNGLIAPPSFPSSFPQTEIPWYVPIIGFLISLTLPMMIVAYYWGKANDFKSGLMVFFVCILCAMFMIMGWYLNEGLLTYMYQ